MEDFTPIPAKRGARKAFREYLNRRFEGHERHWNVSADGRRYHQRVRGYGDYLYAQDRDMFDYEFWYAMRGQQPGFDHSKWVKSSESSGG